jgi:ATP-dependent helicase HrpB
LRLPIDEVLPQVVAALRAGNALVLEAPPGAGKTTRVPPALLDLVDGEIVVLEPRRLAARLAARRVAEERGEAVGQTVGYQVRFEDVGGPGTRIRFVTEGILLRRLVADPTLAGVGAVVLDEFHERHLHADLALALLRRFRPQLKLVVMSATLEAAPVAAFLGDCPVIRSEGKRFPVDVDYADGLEPAAAVRRLIATGTTGDVLVFLPGAAEIHRARAALAPLAARHDLELTMLHGDLPAAEQDRAVRPAARQKVILSTNVAESSVTIPGVRAVIDGGEARVASHSPWTGLPMLRLAKISQASAAQRAGRAGREAPGTCLRLYGRHDHDTRPAHDVPEVRRADLAEAALALHAAGLRNIGAFEWVDAPPAAAVGAAEALLLHLGAVAPDGAVTETGRRMMRYPLHPRLARFMVEAETRGVARDAAVIAAIVGERDLLLRDDPRQRAATVSGPSDLLEAAERFAEAERSGFGRAASLGLDPGAVHAVDRVRKQIQRIAGGRRGPARDEDLLLCVLAGFPDRVAKRRRPGSPELLLCGGGSAEQAAQSVVHEDLLCAVDVEERQTGTSRKVIVRAASAVRPEWLLDLPGIVEEREVVWAGQRVEVVTRLRYDRLVLDEGRGPPAAADAEAAARVLAEAAAAAGPAAFADPEALARWQARVRFVAATFPEAGIIVPEPAEALPALCAGRSSFAELREASLLEALRHRLAPEQLRLVDKMAPERIQLEARAMKIDYEADPPAIASRLQDFFGMQTTPAIAGGRVALVVHLLAPNQRAVQVTRDLAGFWTRHYPALRKQLMRRYPKHAWPEDPGKG